jgi:hypothetical protein
MRFRDAGSLETAATALFAGSYIEQISKMDTRTPTPAPENSCTAV